MVSFVSRLLFIIFQVQAQVIPDCSALGLPSGFPTPLKTLLTLATSPSSIQTPTINPNSGYIQAPIVPPCGCFNPAIGFPNPVIGVQSCGCNNPFGACGCTPVVGNLCGRTTPAIGLATTCGCTDPNVRIIDGCPSCQPVYSYNLPSLGVPSCGCSSVGLSTLGCGVGVPALLPPIGLPACGCSPLGPLYGPCGRPINLCTCNSGCPKPCGCKGPCSCGRSCGCVEVPCGPPKVKTTCTCVTPTVETPCGCAQGKPTCACATTVEVPTCGVPLVPPFAPVIGCSRYMRQIVVQPPFL